MLKQMNINQIDINCGFTLKNKQKEDIPIVVTNKTIEGILNFAYFSSGSQKQNKNPIKNAAAIESKLILRYMVPM